MPRLTVTRFGGGAGRATVNYLITNTFYANTGVVWTVVTNIYLTNLDGTPNPPFSNYLITNIAVSTKYQDNEFGQFVYLPVDNTTTNIAITNENGFISSYFTNQFLETNDFPFTTCDSTQRITTTNIVVNTNPPPSTNIMITNYYCTKVGFTNLVPTAIPDTPTAFGDYTSMSGVLVFDDYQMSADLFPQFVPYDFVPRFPFPRKRVNRVLIVQISNPQLDAFESPDIAPPTAISVFTNTLVNILDQSTPAPFVTAPNPEPPASWAVPGTTVFNFEYATIRCTENVNGFRVARIFVRRTS